MRDKYFNIVIRRFFTILGSLMLSYLNVSAQCPEVEAIMINACGTEEWSEFIIVNSGSVGFNTSSFTIDFNANNNGCGTTPGTNNDIGVNFNNCSTNMTPCGWNNGDISMFSGCSNLISIGDGYAVPPNSIVIVQMSSRPLMTALYNFTSLCGLGQCVYVLKNSCTRTNGAYSNATGGGLQTTNYDFGAGCTQTAIYNSSGPGFANSDGQFYLPPTDAYGDNNCVPPPSTAAAFGATVDQPADVIKCGGEMIDVIFTGTAGSYSWTNTNTSIGLGGSGVGDLSFMAANVTTTQTGTIVVTPVGPCPGPPKTFTITVNPAQDPTFTFNDWCEGNPNVPTSIATPGGTFSFMPLPGDGATINPSTGVITGAVNGTSYSIHYLTPGPCPSMSVVVAMQMAATSAAFTFANFCVGAPNGPVPTNTGGTWSFNPNPGGGVTINATTGEISGEVAGATYTVQYTTGAPCGQTATQMVMILPLINPVLPALGPYCTSDPAVNLPATVSGITGVWSGNGVTGTVFNPNVGNGTYTLTFTPDAGQCANVATTSVTVNANPMGNLVGSPILCPGQCDQVMFSFTGGSGVFNVTLNIMAGPFNFNFTVPGVTNSTALNLCLSNNFPPFNPGTNTINVPTATPPGTYSLTLVSFASTSGPCATGIVGTPGMISLTVAAAPTANDAAISKCDFDQNGTEIFDLTTVQGTITSPPNTIAWFTNSTLTNPIGNPSSFSAGNNTTVYAQVTNSDGCTSVADVVLTLIAPVVLNPSDYNSCVNGPIINLTTTVAGVNGVWSGTNVISSGTQFDPTGLAVGTYSIAFTPSDPLACVLPATADVIISAGQPININDPISTTCLGGGNIVLPSDIGGISGTWSGSPFINGNVFNVTNSGSGNFTITFTPVGGGCFTPNTTVVIVNPNIVLVAPIFASVCAGAANVILPTAINGYAGSWSGIGVSGNVFNPNQAPGTYTLTFAPTDPCATVITSTITVNAATVLIPPALGPTCVTGNPIVLPLIVTGVAGTWTFNSTAISVFNPATYGVGNYNLVFTPTGSNPCIPAINVTISVGQIFAGSDRNVAVCNIPSNIVDLNAYLSPAASSGGQWSYNNVNIPNPTNYNLSGLSAGNQIFRYIVFNAQCGSDTSFVTLVISSLNNAGNDPTVTNLCQNNTSIVNIDAIVGPRDMNGIWIIPSGTSIDFTNIDSVNLSSLGAGNFVLKYTIPLDGCPSDTSTHTFVISTFNDAGGDDITTSCIGSIVNLATLINTTYLGGIYSNPNGHPGLTGVTWNTSGLSAGPYSFLYIANNVLPCEIDTATLTINLASSINAGQDQGAFYCEDEVVNLDDFIIDPLAAKGGAFFRNNIVIPNGVFDTKSSTGSLVFLYVVGDGVSCPKDTSIITLTKISAPLLTFNTLTAICEDDCTTLKIDHNLNPGAKAYFRIVNNLGLVTTREVIVLDALPILLQFCGASMPPYNFSNLLPNLTYTVFLDSVVTTVSAKCVFNYGQLVNFFVNPRPTKTVTANICKGSTIKIGSDVYSESKLTGTTIIAVPPNIGCDSVITVSLTLINATAPVTIQRTTCNQAFSLVVGPTTFNKANPVGSVTLKNAGGCDSIVNVNLSFVNPPVTNFAFSTCDPSYTISIGGQTFNQAKKTGVAIIVNGSVLGCDSTINVALSFLPKGVNNFEAKTCDDKFSVTFGNQTFNMGKPIGQAILSNSAKNGCDSVVNVKIEFVPASVNNFSISSCDQAFTIKVGNETFSSSRPTGSVKLTGASATGCDSIVNVDLSFRALAFTHSLVYKCGESIPTFNINIASQPGPYTLIINNTTVGSNQTLPYSSQLPIGDNRIILETPQGCRDTLDIKVDANSAGPAVQLIQTPLLDGFTQINTIAPPNVIYDLKWSPTSTLSCNDCPDPIADPAPTTTYTLTYLYGNDCLDTTSITIKEVPSKDITIANVILLGSNGGNGTFYVKMPDGVIAQVKRMSIYDRWGNLVFNAKNVPADDPSVGWNGLYNSQLVNPGVFVYFIELQIEGKSKQDIFKGDLTVIR